MPDRDDQSQSTIESLSKRLWTVRSRPVRNCWTKLSRKTCQQQHLLTLSKELGLKAAEAIDYIEKYKQRVEIRRSKAKQCDSSSDNPPQDEPTGTQEERDKAVEEAAWATLRSP
jgi:hypothetical protein